MIPRQHNFDDDFVSALMMLKFDHRVFHSFPSVPRISSSLCEVVLKVMQEIEHSALRNLLQIQDVDSIFFHDSDHLRFESRQVPMRTNHTRLCVCSEVVDVL